MRKGSDLGLEIGLRLGGSEAFNSSEIEGRSEEAVLSESEGSISGGIGDPRRISGSDSGSELGSEPGEEGFRRVAWRWERGEGVLAARFRTSGISIRLVGAGVRGLARGLRSSRGRALERARSGLKVGARGGPSERAPGARVRTRGRVDVFEDPTVP